MVLTGSDIRSTPTLNASNAVCTAHGSIVISAPPSLVWEILLDFSAYSTWNQYTPGLELSSLAPDSYGTLQYRPGTSGPTKGVKIRLISVEQNEQERSIAWEGLAVPTWMMRVERVQTVKAVTLDDGSEGAEYSAYETFAGALAYATRLAMGSKLDAFHEGIAGNLKEYAEKKAASRT